MNGETPKTRYHAEVKIPIEGHDARVNCFADTLAEIFNDIATILNQYPGDWKNPAKREIANAELKANQLKQKLEKDSFLKTDSAALMAGPTVFEIPVCQECGINEFMELIKWTDKVTLKPRQAWKCQQCQKWVRNNGKGR